MSLTVLFICTGNVCRSPIAECLLRARLAPTAPVVCASAGVHALLGRPVDPPSAAVLRELGGDPGGHVAKQLTHQQVLEADLVLAADVEHRAAVLQLEPLAFRRTFTLLEFARLGQSLGPATIHGDELGLRSRVVEVSGQRGIVETVDPREDAVADPFGRPLSAARSSGLQISVAVDALIAVMGLARAESAAAAG